MTRSNIQTSDANHTIQKPWLSILVPVYQVESYLKSCAVSILDQVDIGVEIIFLDDASTDGCFAILKSLTETYCERIRVLQHSQNQGISAARNTLLKAASGTYIWFIDSDDLLEPNAIAELKSIINAHSPDMVMCDFRRFDDAIHSNQRAQNEHIRSFHGCTESLCHDQDLLLTGLFQSGQLHPWSKIIRKACWPQDLVFPVGQIFEDLAVYPRLALHIQNFYYAPKVWIAYRQRAESALSTLSTQKIHDWMNALVNFPQEITVFAPELKPSTKFEIAHFCARTFIRAAKKQSRLSVLSGTSWLPHWATLWQLSSPLSYRELMRNYFLRGYWLRALQFAYWVRIQKKLNARFSDV